MPFTFGKLAKNLIKLSCITVDATQKSACYIASNFTNSYKTRKSLQKFSNQISDAINDVSVPVSDFAENVIDGSVVLAGDLTGEAAKKVCELCDASPETITAAEKYGKVIGKAAVGFAIGNVAASGLTSALSATGTAGAAATTSGLAALGGSNNKRIGGVGRQYANGNSSCQRNNGGVNRMRRTDSERYRLRQITGTGQLSID